MDELYTVQKSLIRGCGKANYLFSVSAFIQFFLLIVALPLASQLLLQRLHLSALQKDRQLVLASSLVSALGAFCIAFAPRIGLAIFGKLE